MYGLCIIIVKMILIGDALEKLKELKSESIDCCITSPPYYGLRNYGHEKQIGLENSPQEYIANLINVCREIKRVLKKNGTFWLNLGDSYNNATSGGNGATGGLDKSTLSSGMPPVNTTPTKKSTDPNLKPKDLMGIPWRTALALQDDGWWLRQDIVWNKLNPMPESVTDRCTKSHEYVFLLTKSAHYYFDHESIKEPITHSSAIRLAQNIAEQKGSNRVPGKVNGNMKAVGRKQFDIRHAAGGTNMKGHGAATKPDGTPFDYVLSGKRNKRSVWNVATKSYKGAHFATFPVNLIIPMIKAGCPEGGIVLDPFFGSGTTGLAAKKLGRRYLGIELNEEYVQLAKDRLAQETLL